MTAQIPSPHLPKQSGIYVAAFAAIKDKDGDVLLLKRADMNKWCFPGGLIEIGESLTDGLIRECKEEIGAIINIHSFQGCYSSPERHLFSLNDGRKLHYFAFVFNASLPSETIELQLEEKEVLDSGYFSLSDLPELVPSHRCWIEDCFQNDGQPFFR